MAGFDAACVVLCSYYLARISRQHGEEWGISNPNIYCTPRWFRVLLYVVESWLYTGAIEPEDEDSMNLNILEKITRQANVATESNNLFSKGFITPAEHKSLSSLSWQIAANVRANGPGAGTYAKATIDGSRGWI
ncbi:MAG: hypothetical protein ABIU10_00870 [Sphingomicrobium sp.]